MPDTSSRRSASTASERRGTYWAARCEASGAVIRLGMCCRFPLASAITKSGQPRRQWQAQCAPPLRPARERHPAQAHMVPPTLRVTIRPQ